MRKYLILFALTASIIAYRIYVLLLFGFKYTDSDQTILWLGTNHYAHGLFYEPYFYGQDYNLMVEAFLSIPFYWFGIPLHLALPITTTLLTILPFFLLARIALLKGLIVNATLIISLLALLPIEYDLVTSLSRGFISGIAMFSFVLLVNTKSIEKWGDKELLLTTFFASLAYIATPNSILLSIPILFYLFLLNYKNKKYYIYSMIGGAFGLIIYIVFQRFYFLHPNYDLHGYHLSFSIDFLYKGLSKLDFYFRMVTPIFWKQGFFTILFPLLFFGYFLRKRKKELAIVSICLPFIILGTMALSKVHDGNDSVFFHVSRMYLALPILWSFLLTYVDFGDKKFMSILLIIPFIGLGVKAFNLEKSVESNLNKEHIVVVTRTDKLIKDCGEISKLAQKQNIDLIVFLSFNDNQLYNYGCPSCEENFPKTVYPLYERRTWRLKEDDTTVYKNILIFDDKNRLDSLNHFIQKSDEMKNVYFIKNNKLTTSNIYQTLKIEVRKFQ